MSLTKTVGFVAVTTLAVGGAAFGQNDMQAQIADLQAQIAELKGAQGGQWLTEQRAAEIRGIVTDVLADADTRASLQGAGGTSGYNGGFFLNSADGNFSMKFNVLEQMRWSFNDRDTDGAGADSTHQANGFENKRTRLTFSGNVVDSTWTYKTAFYFGYANNAEFGDFNLATGGFDNGDGTFLADASVSKDFGNGLSLTAGQFKNSFTAEYNLDAGNMQFSDYSLVNTILGQAFGAGYGQGLHLAYAADQFRGGFSYVNSLNEINADWDANSPSDATLGQSDWAIAARGEFKFAGDWAQFNDAQSWKGEGYAGMIGFGYASQNFSDDLVGTPATWTIDGTVEFGGANVNAAYYSFDGDATGLEITAFTIAGGVFVTDNFEVVGRYENFDIDGGAEISTFTVGGNYYMAKNTAKLGVELGFALDPLPVDATYANWLASSEDGEWVLRGQMSFSF